MVDDGRVSTPLDPGRVAALRAAPFSYDAIGATATALPPGFRHLRRSRVLARRDVERAAEELLSWEVHRRAGIGVATSAPRVGIGEVVVLRLGGRIGVDAPCRIVDVVDEPHRVGFAYGTLPGHPESGEELFVLERGRDGTVTFSITAFSRPASWLTYLGGPIARMVQDRITTRYLRAAEG